MESLEVDGRVSEDLERILDDDMALVKRKLEFQVEKSKVAMDKLKKHFTDCLAGFPVCVKAVHKSTQVKTLRQRRLLEKLFEMEAVIEQKIIEAEIKGRSGLLRRYLTPNRF